MKIYDADPDADYEVQIVEEKARERHARRVAASLLAEAVVTSSVEHLYEAVKLIDCATRGFLPVLCRWAGRKSVAVPAEIQEAFLSMYVQRKQLAFQIDNPAALIRLLRTFLPTNYSGPALDVYRGASRREMLTGRYGVSWTTDPSVAEDFAIQSKRSGPAVVFRATAAPAAVLLVRPNLGSYDESEVILDPSKLDNITAIQTL